ncbi:transmembrane amino acid transporter protein-domain-containing protein [Cokeromyces recurvatus]|uniref:transmembrane amino acid transporter protein-domain-containing protein n=1 Tax=Cokeromyces recurvatus TaxID=90255 RepID=UPI00222017C4|nr:transmembrane amino acid transporter protein-domain-containing protein [Cokeromyces recurvatus]KAI7905038.1 transmembrane amino acid transporter protein-domain-containing protein [Cokeromyces recurvatus]
MSDNNNNNNVRGTADLSKIRSKSYELPRYRKEDKKRTSYTHFTPMATMPNQNNMPRPHFNRMNTTGQYQMNRQQIRPKVSSRTNTSSFIGPSAKRMSMARTISSLSLYSNFAGEHLDDHHHHHHRHSKPNLDNNMIDEEKRDSYDSTIPSSSVHKHEVSFIDEAHVEDLEDTTAPKASVGKAMFMFLKAFIGSGVLFLPKAFQNGGLALSIVLMVVIAVICLFAFLRLVNTQKIIGGSYGDIGGVLYGQIVRFIVLFFICISQIGFVCSYFIFVSGNLVNVVDVLSNCTAHIAQKYYIWMPLIILIPFALVRHIAKLSFTAVIADILILFGLVCIIYFTAARLKDFGIGPNVAAVNPRDFALMIGTATFSFEGIGLIIPIVESMERPEKFPFVLTLGMIIVCVIYILIGTLSYLAYGDTTQSAVIYNFPSANRLTITVQLLYSLAICLTAPLMLFPALKIIENGLFYKFKSSGRESLGIKWSKNVYRTILCIVCAAIAFGIGGDNLDKFVSLVGSIACVPLCFIFPGMFHLKVSKKMLDHIWDYLLIIFGTGIMIYTLYVNINSWVHLSSVAEPATSYCPS